MAAWGQGIGEYFNAYLNPSANNSQDVSQAPQAIELQVQQPTDQQQQEEQQEEIYAQAMKLESVTNEESKQTPQRDLVCISFNLFSLLLLVVLID